MNPLEEGIHESLRAIYDEFEKQAQLFNSKWTIDEDDPNIQSYRLMDCRNPVGFVRHMANFIKDYQVDLEVNGEPTNLDDTNTKGYVIKPKKNGVTLKFMIEPLQENEDLSEDQYKTPTKAHTLKQAPFRASHRRHKTAFTYHNDGGRKKKKKKKRKRKLKEDVSFEDRLLHSLDEAVSPQITFTAPDAILTITDSSKPEIDLKSALLTFKESQQELLAKYLNLLEDLDDVSSHSYLEELAESCTQHINLIDLILEGDDDSTD